MSDFTCKFQQHSQFEHGRFKSANRILIFSVGSAGGADFEISRFRDLKMRAGGWHCTAVLLLLPDYTVQYILTAVSYYFGASGHTCSSAMETNMTTTNNRYDHVLSFQVMSVYTWYDLYGKFLFVSFRLVCSPSD